MDERSPTFGDHGRRDVTTRTWYDHWRRRQRTATYRGRCVVCGRATWNVDDGENDPRGVLGDNAASPLVAADYDYDMIGGRLPDIPLCFPCANDYDRYRKACTVARDRWGFTP